MCCHFLFQGTFRTQVIDPASLALAGGSFTAMPPGKPSFDDSTHLSRRSWCLPLNYVRPAHSGPYCSLVSHHLPACGLSSATWAPHSPANTPCALLPLLVLLPAGAPCISMKAGKHPAQASSSFPGSCLTPAP